MNNKEVIFVYSYHGVGGAQRRAANLADEFIASGYKSFLVALYGEDGTISQENYYRTKNSVPLVLVSDFYKHTQCDKEVRKSLFFRRSAIASLKVLRKLSSVFPDLRNKVDRKIYLLKESIPFRTFLQYHKNAIVINMGFNIFEMTYYAARGLGCHLIYGETNAIDKYKDDMNFGATKNLLKKAKAYVFQTREQMEKLFPEKNPSDSYIIYNPIKEGLPEPFFGERKKTIVNFCALKPQKNLLLLIRAFQMFRSKYPEYRLCIYADKPDQTSDYREVLLSYIRENSLENAVLLLPMSDRVHELVRDVAMFVSSSDYEGISNSMIEAMAIGLPCVCTDCHGGGAREMIQNGVNGLLVPRGDVDSLCDAMIRFAEDPEFAEQCGKNGERIKEQLSIDTISREWLEIVQKVK